MRTSTDQKNPGGRRLREWLRHGEINKIALKTHLSRKSVSKALEKEHPGHPAVKAALELIASDGRQQQAAQLKQLVSDQTETVVHREVPDVA